MGKKAKLHNPVAQKLIDDALDTRKAAFTQRARADIYALLEEKAPRERDKVLRYLAKRFETEGDKFTQQTSYGYLNEAVIGIYTGTIKTKKDVLDFVVGNSTAYVIAGDLSIPQTNKPNVEMQVKGNFGHIGVHRGTKLVLNRLGDVDEGVWKVQNLVRSFETYIRTSPPNIRMGLPIYQFAGAGFFDFGHRSFLSLAYMVPGAFKFERPRYSTLFGRTDGHIVKEILDGLGNDLFGVERPNVKKDLEAELEKLLKISLKSSKEELEEKIKANIKDLRLEVIYRYGQIRFNYLAFTPRIARMINPLINTGIGREDNKDPFYKLLRELYGKDTRGSLIAYLDENYTTFENKLPENYYSHNYADVTY